MHAFVDDLAKLTSPVMFISILFAQQSRQMTTKKTLRIKSAR
jgi:hypothetical protein